MIATYAPMFLLFALGALFILTTLFLPKGILGLIMRRREKPATPPPALKAAASQPGAAE